MSGRDLTFGMAGSDVFTLHIGFFRKRRRKGEIYINIIMILEGRVFIWGGGTGNAFFPGLLSRRPGGSAHWTCSRRSLMLLPLERSSISKIAEGSAENFCGRSPACHRPYAARFAAAGRVVDSLRTTQAAYSCGFLPEMTARVGGVCLISATEAHPPIAKGQNQHTPLHTKSPIKTSRQPDGKFLPAHVGFIPDYGEKTVLNCRCHRQRPR